MRKISNSLKIKPTTSSASILMMSMLSACGKTPSEQIKAITEDKYPVANMPDEPLERCYEKSS